MTDRALDLFEANTTIAIKNAQIKWFKGLLGVSIALHLITTTLMLALS